VIRLEAAMSTSRFTRLIGVPERSYRRWQQRQREGRPVKGPWPAPARDRVEPSAIAYADRFPAWGHRKLTHLVATHNDRGDRLPHEPAAAIAFVQ
jgi:putative transposase